MNTSENGLDGVSRRDAIRCGLGSIAGVVMLCSASGRGAFAATTGKLAKTDVQYVDVSKVAGKDCDDCSQFVPGRTAKDPATCKIVEGDISPRGHCIAFSPKPRS